MLKMLTVSMRSCDRFRGAAAAWPTANGRGRRIVVDQIADEGFDAALLREAAQHLILDGRGKNVLSTPFGRWPRRRMALFLPGEIAPAFC